MKPKSEQLKIALKITEAEEAGTPIEWEAFNEHRQEWEPSYTLAPDSPTGLLCLVAQGVEIRIKPFALGPTINGHTLGPGQEWHRTDFTREDLPAGTRPYVRGEIDQPNDYWESNGKWLRLGDFTLLTLPTLSHHCKRRTTRPLPSPVGSIPEGWRELEDGEKNDQWVPGAKWLSSNGIWLDNEVDATTGTTAFRALRIIIPIPLFAEKQAHAAGKKIQWLGSAGWRDYVQFTHAAPGVNDWMEWRIAPEPALVPLGPQDIEPGSTVRRAVWQDRDWTTITDVTSCGVWIGVNKKETSWIDLIEGDWLIHRPSAPGVWSKCEKEAAQP